MGLFENFRNWLLAPLIDNDTRQRFERVELLRNYRRGEQRRFLKVRPGQTDDNLVINFAGLVIDRAVTMLFGQGIKFDLPGDPVEVTDAEGNTELVPPPEQQYVDAVMDANKQQILFHKTALLGGEQGTCYLKLIPGAYTQMIDDREVLIPRLVALDPAWLQIETGPHDIEDVLRYTITYVVGDTAYRQVIEKDSGVDVSAEMEQEAVRPVSWQIIDYVSGPRDNGKWRETNRQTWEYEFPPILHWQNLPEPTDVYGLPDVTDDVIELQDRLNFIASNISKVIRLYAHPQRYGRNLGTSSGISLGPDDMPTFDGPDAEIRQLDPTGDMAAAFNFYQGLRQSLFDVTQTVDLSTASINVGNLTNFGLKILYNDALAKLSVKRSLYQDALLELVRRLLVLGEYGDYHTANPGVVIWPEILPVNEAEQIQVVTADVGLGILSKQTAAEIRGYDWEQEKPRLEDETQANTNLGDLLIQNFTRGTGGVGGNA